MPGVKKLRRRSAFVKLFGSYLLILGFMLVIEIGVSAMVLRTAREQAETLNLSLMQMVKNECDNQISSIFRHLDQLALEEQVQTLSNVMDSFESEDQYMAYSLYSELRSIEYSSEEYRLLYIYFANTDTVISSTGNMSLQMYYDLYYQELDISLEELRTFLSQQHYHDICVLSGGEGANEIMYAMTSLETDIGEASATIIIQLTSDAIDERIDSAKWDDAILVSVMNSQNQSVNSASLTEEVSNLNYEEIPVESNFSIDLDGKRYMGVATRSEETDWIYLLLAPFSIVESGARRMQFFSFLGIGICLIVGFFFSWYLSNRNYNPIRGLMDLFKKERGDSSDIGRSEEQNEYQWLESKAESLFQENKSFQQTLERNRKRLLEFYLYRLLANSYETLDSSERKLLTESGITDGIWRVIILSTGSDVQDTEKDVPEDEQDKLPQDLKQFIIGNVTGELLNEVFPTHMLDVGEYVIALVRLNEMNTDNYDLMWGALGKAYELIKDKFHFYMQICAGTAKEGLENIHISYQESRETQAYAPLLETHFINYDDIKNRSKRYYYPIEIETRIMTAIADGLADPAILAVKEVLRVNYQENHITARMLSCLGYDLLGTLVKSADLAGCGEFFEENRVDLEQMGHGTCGEMERRFEQLIRELCSCVEGTGEDGSANLVDRLQKYILENYQNPDLNISQAALYMDKTPAYISSVYKK